MQFKCNLNVIQRVQIKIKKKQLYSDSFTTLFTWNIDNYELQ